jgi:hypothetical protein
MSEIMVEIIIIIIIIIIVRNQRTKNNNDKVTGNREQSVQTISANDAGQRKQLPTKQSMNQQRTSNVSGASAGYRRNYQRNYDEDGSAKAHKENTQTKATTQMKSIENEIVQGENESTIDYLQRKAMIDEREHKKEAFEQKRAERENYGSIVYAKRWMEGDSIPASRHLIKCGYCGAENLVPIKDKTKYHCYFCREKL